jgi:hypothetical protein
MAAFAELADVRRAAEWTEATGRWLAGCPRPCCSPASAGSTAPRCSRARANGPTPSAKPAWSVRTWKACTSPPPPRATTSSASSSASAATWPARGGLAAGPTAWAATPAGPALLRRAQGRTATAAASIRPP